MQDWQTNLTNLAWLGIASALDLVGPLLGETNAEDAKHIVVCCLHIHMSLNKTLPLAHKRPQLVSCEVHTLYVPHNLVWAPSPYRSTTSNAMQPHSYALFSLRETSQREKLETKQCQTLYGRSHTFRAARPHPDLIPYQNNAHRSIESRNKYAAGRRPNHGTELKE